MVSKQYLNGKANEWAIAQSVSSLLGVRIRIDSGARECQEAFEKIDLATRQNMVVAADLMVEHIVRLQAGSNLEQRPIEVAFAPDSAGIHGDVRDVWVFCEGNTWGISCKNNHSAYKHSRLSLSIDWVRKWGLSDRGCSKGYFEAIRPVFLELDELRRTSNGVAKFSEIKQLHERIYQPVLTAFESELTRICEKDPHAAQGLLRYVVGNQDFFKVISHKDRVLLQVFNFSGSLGTQKSKLPSRVLSVDRDEGSVHSINLRFDRGYTFNFRLHSAKSTVEPSLKFDIQALSLPPNEIYQHVIHF